MDDDIKLWEKTNTGESGKYQVHDSIIELITL